jgi:hypothetical protein
MKKDFTHENFERFLKESADGLKMRPSADVWNRIDSRMNRRRRWVFLTSAFFLLTVSLFGYLIVDQSKNVADPFAGMPVADKAKNAPAKRLEQEVATHAVPKTTQRKAAAKNTVTNSAATELSSKRTTPVPIRPAIASAFKTPVNSSNPSTHGQLFQNPIAQPDDNIGISKVIAGITPVILDEYEPARSTAPATNLQQKASGNEIPTVESVVNSYVPKGRKWKSEFQLYFTPTISYRRLTENKSYLRAVPQNMATSTLAALYDVNSMVEHKPDMGLELGFAFKYPVSPRIKLRTGMQFNITRYDIKAFTYVPERATIALNTRTRGVDSVNTISSYRNFSGGRANWLQNFYFQVSTPVGVEVALSPAKKRQFGMAATIQPTYVLGDRAYLISTDYKNYSQVPWLMRRWNVNTSLETFVSYSTGTLRWQVGPQVRYQLLSSFVEKYPVKENLFDYGLKIAVSIDKK